MLKSKHLPYTYSQEEVSSHLSDKDLIDRSPLNFLRSEDNKATYYRGDGSPILEIFYHAFKDLFQGINLTEKYSAGLIKPNRFKAAMKIACGNRYKYVSMQSIKDCPEGNDPCFMDLSDWIKGKLPRGWSSSEDEWDSLHAEIEDVLAQTKGKEVLVGGVVELNPFVGVYIFFNSIPEKQQPDTSPYYSLISDMLNYRGNVGSYPEMIMLKQALAESGCRVESKACPTKSSDEDLLASTPLKTPEIDPFYPYAYIVNQLLPEVLSLPSKPEILQAKNKIATSIQKLLTPLPFQTALNEYYFLLEQILFLSAFITPPNELEETIRATLPKEGQEGTILCYNSGMACYDYILEMVRAEYPPDSNPNLFIQPGSYYELQDDLKWLIKPFWETNQDLPPNVILLDLYPNNVKLDDAHENPVETTIKNALNGKPPLTVVVDLSTTLLTAPRIWEIKRNLDPLIQEGKLRLILATSLAKFYSCGFDKFTGGALVYFGKDPHLPHQLKKVRDQDPISNEAKAFFSLMIGKSMEGIERFYKKSLENTDLLYKQITESKLQETLKLQKKGDNIPVIGFSSPLEDEDEQRQWASQVQDNLSKKALEKGCPLFVRASFPFPHSTVVECDTALRWIAGLDTPLHVKEYGALIAEASKEVLVPPTGPEG